MIYSEQKTCLWGEWKSGQPREGRSGEERERVPSEEKEEMAWWVDRKQRLGTAASSIPPFLQELKWE